MFAVETVLRFGNLANPALVDTTRRLARVVEANLRSLVQNIQNESGDFLSAIQDASRHSYRWWKPPTLGNATTFAIDDGRRVTALKFGVSLFNPKWQRSP